MSSITHLDCFDSSLNEAFYEENVILNKSQKSIHKEAKRTLSEKKKFTTDYYRIYYDVSEDEDDNLSNSDSSIQFQSFSLSEPMVVSPIAHEMS